MEPLPFHIIRVPNLQKYTESDPAIQVLAHKFRNFRLHALKSNPEAFGASFEQESERGIDHTFERLSNPKATHFVAIKATSETQGEAIDQNTFETLMKAAWLGTIVLLGPQDGLSSAPVSAKADPFCKMTASAKQMSESNSDATEFHYHLNGMFVDISARRSGIGRALILAAVDRAAQEVKSAKVGLKCSILVDTENANARRLYERSGFIVVGEETYLQQPRRQSSGELRVSTRSALRLDYTSDNVVHQTLHLVRPV